MDVASAMVRTIVQGGSPEVVSNAGHRRLGWDAPTLKPGQHRIGARLAVEDRRPRGVLHRGSPAREPEKRDVAQRWVEGTAGKRLVRAREGRNTGGNLLHLIHLSRVPVMQLSLCAVTHGAESQQLTVLALASGRRSPRAKRNSAQECRGGHGEHSWP
jgi:hypothetical protein